MSRLAAVSVAVLLVACTHATSTPADPRATWESVGIRDYVWTWNGGYAMGGSRTVETTVRRAEPVRVVSELGLVPIRKAQSMGPLTVEDLFETIDRLAAESGFAVTYDPVYGYPSSVTAGLGNDTMDDEVTYTVEAFRPLHLEEVDAARARWDASGVSEYRWTLTPRCFCGLQPTTVTVRGGVPVDVVVNGHSIQPAEWDETQLPSLTVEAVFAQIDENAGADALSYTFDPELGYPTSVQADVWKEAVDDEWSLTIDRFQRLEL